jgi:hypothetical protein
MRPRWQLTRGRSAQHQTTITECQQIGGVGAPIRELLHDRKGIKVWYSIPKMSLDRVVAYLETSADRDCFLIVYLKRATAIVQPWHQ